VHFATLRNGMAKNGLVPSEQLLIAGYVIVRLAASPPSQSLPSSVLTISDCIMDDLPRPEFWDWFQSPATALAAQRQQSATRLITVAMREDDARPLVAEMGGPEQPYFELLRRRVPTRGEVLGFEVVGAEETLDFHSWHCHGYADDVKEALGIQVNDVGLLDTYEDAAAVLRWMLALSSDEAPAPVPWVVVALCDEGNEASHKGADALSKVPVFVIDGHDIDLYPDAERAAREIEGYDAQTLDYVGADGIVYKATVDGLEWGPVTLHRTRENRLGDLIQLLRSEAAARGLSLPPDVPDDPHAIWTALLAMQDEQLAQRRAKRRPWWRRPGS
jgi:hypothetical protein